MSDNDVEMVKIPWHDGTEREVPLGTLVEVKRSGGNTLYYACRNGCSVFSDLDGTPWEERKVLRVLRKASEPPIVADVPTKVGAVIVVGDSVYVRVSDSPDLSLFESEWVDNTGLRVTTGHIKKLLGSGEARVVSEGVDVDVN